MDRHRKHRHPHWGLRLLALADTVIARSSRLPTRPEQKQLVKEAKDSAARGARLADAARREASTARSNVQRNQFAQIVAGSLGVAQADWWRMQDARHEQQAGGQ